MVQRRDELETALVQKFGSWEVTEERTLVPKRPNKTKGYEVGVPVIIHKTKTIQFNPGSREHCTKVLMEAGWVPEKLTPSGKPQLDEAVLETIKLPAAQLLIDYLIVQKRLGQLADGAKGWLRLVRNGKVHASYNCTSGTVTFRSSHSNPNIAQVPKVQYGPSKELLRGVDGAWGYECRELFGVPRGWLLVGADMAGCQLRALGHYAAYFDGGAYATAVTDGDVHMMHLDACRPHVKTRDAMKTTIYAFIFGAMDGKLGSTNGGSRQLGSKIRKALLSKVPGLGKADKALKMASKKGYIKAIDGRKVYTKQERLALNYALQSFEAIVCKTWLVSFYDQMHALGYGFGWDGDFVICGWVHDELQVACRQGLETQVGELLVKCAKAAGDPYKVKVKLDSSYKVGSNWAETH